jgi:hypothetical protein
MLEFLSLDAFCRVFACVEHHCTVPEQVMRMTLTCLGQIMTKAEMLETRKCDCQRLEWRSVQSAECSALSHEHMIGKKKDSSIGRENCSKARVAESGAATWWNEYLRAMSDSFTPIIWKQCMSSPLSSVPPPSRSTCSNTYTRHRAQATSLKLHYYDSGVSKGLARHQTYSIKSNV